MVLSTSHTRWARNATSLALLLIGSLAMTTAADADVQDGPVPYSMDAAWLAKQSSSAPALGGRRSLMSNNAGSCNVQLVGTGKKFGVASCRITCTGSVTLMVGNPIYSYYQSHRGNFRGVTIIAPQQAYSAEPVLFFSNQKITLTGYAKNLVVDQWAITHFEAGSVATIKNFQYSNNKGYRFTTLAAARARISVVSSSWSNNKCTASSCHTGGIYVTEGSVLTVANSQLKGNQGNLAGGMMITSGAAAVVSGTTFTENSTPNYGQFGGAVLNDWCSDPRARTKTQFLRNKFIRNNSNGFGGAIRLGTSQGGGCPNTIVKGNTFSNNKAAISGGAIYLAYCNGQRTDLKDNTFSGNVGVQYAGHITANKGQCPKPDVQGSTFISPNAAMSPVRFVP